MTANVWDEAPGLELPQLTEDVIADVCVIGLGGSGLAAMDDLVRAGISAIGIDAGTVACGAAGRNAGFLLAGLAEPLSVVEKVLRPELARIAYELTLVEIAQVLIDCPDEAERTGSLRIAASVEEQEDCRIELETLRRNGFEAEWYEGPEGSGLLFPRDGVCQPLARCRRVARSLVEWGAALHQLSPAVDIRPGRVTTPKAAIICDKVIVAVDGGLERLLPELAPRVRSTRLQMLATAPAPEVSFTRPVYCRYGYDYWRQLPDQRIVLGGRRDKFIDAEWGKPAEPSDEVQSELDRLLRVHLGVTAPVTHRWAGVVAYTTDGLPVIEEVRPGVIAAGAYSGTGNVVGALAGRAAADLAVTGKSAHALVLTGRP